MRLTVWNLQSSKAVTKAVHYSINISSQVFMTVNVEIVSLWVVTPCNTIGGYQRPNLRPSPVPFLWVSLCSWPHPLQIHLNPEDGGSLCLWNVGIHLQHYMVSQLRRPHSEHYINVCTSPSPLHHEPYLFKYIYMNRTLYPTWLFL
jgi:hypothetical protein